MLLYVVSVACIAAVNLIGLGVLVRWLVRHIHVLEGNVRVLEGTVQAQQETLDTIGGLNRMAIEVIKAMDPERWAKEVQIHKDLADKKAAALIEDEKQRIAKGTGAAIGDVLGRYEAIFGLTLSVMPYIPKAQRAGLIRASVLGPLEAPLLKLADETIDLSVGLNRLLSIADFAPRSDLPTEPADEARPVPGPPNLAEDIRRSIPDSERGELGGPARRGDGREE